MIRLKASSIRLTTLLVIQLTTCTQHFTCDCDSQRLLGGADDICLLDELILDDMLDEVIVDDVTWSFTA